MANKPLRGQRAFKGMTGYDVYFGERPKLIVFADAHVGEYKYPIREHILSSLEQIRKFSAKVEPDAVLFAGDAFRTRVPPASQLREFGEYIDAIAKTAINGIYMTPGNHDLAGRGATTLDVFDFYENVHVLKEPDCLDLGDWQLVTVPWLPQKAAASFGADGESTHGAIEMLLRLLASKLDKEKESILLAHASALGGTMGSETSTLITSDVLWPSGWFKMFGTCFLGHLHRPQTVPGTDNAHYTGSICPVSFNETEQEKSFIYFHDGVVERIPLKTPKFIQAEVSELGEIEEDKNAFLQIKVRHDEEEPDTIPKCAWYEIVTIPPKRDQRQRLSSDDAMKMTTEDALKRYMELEDVPQELMQGALALAEKLLDEEEK